MSRSFCPAELSRPTPDPAVGPAARPTHYRVGHNCLRANLVPERVRHGGGSIHLRPHVGRYIRHDRGHCRGAPRHPRACRALYRKSYRHPAGRPEMNNITGRRLPYPWNVPAFGGRCGPRVRRCLLRGVCRDAPVAGRPGPGLGAASRPRPTHLA